jgi:hypothetical protein
MLFLVSVTCPGHRVYVNGGSTSQPNLDDFRVIWSQIPCPYLRQHFLSSFYWSVLIEFIRCHPTQPENTINHGRTICRLVLSGLAQWFTCFISGIGQNETLPYSHVLACFWQLAAAILLISLVLGSFGTRIVLVCKIVVSYITKKFTPTNLFLLTCSLSTSASSHISYLHFFFDHFIILRNSCFVRVLVRRFLIHSAQHCSSSPPTSLQSLSINDHNTPWSTIASSPPANWWRHTRSSHVISHIN